MVDIDGGAGLDTGGTLIHLRQTPTVVSTTSGRDVAALLTDLETFWSRQLEGAFTTPRGGYLLTDTADVRAVSSGATASSGPTASPTSTPAAPSAGPGASAGPTADYSCAGNADALRSNAFYCPGDDAIVIDAGALVPVVRSSYGIGGLAAALAHEYGHLVQARIGPTSAQQRDDPERYPQVLIEAQADCAAGAYLAWAAGTSPVPGTARLNLPVATLPRSISTLVDFRDSATAPTSELFHGYGLDRLRAVVRGYQQGARSCAAMRVGDLDLTLGRAGTTAPSATERYPDAAAVAGAANAALDSFDPGARGVAARASDADLAAATEIGQFAQGSATVLAFGRRRIPAAADCYLGAFSRARYGHSAAGTLGSWRSDADEAMDLVIARSTASATGWAQITEFVTGFGGGLAACR
ncbi:neutral zinc metallopeptidase [Nakamurella sp. A5-74]|uniref:Neutral zinc metallopeptidase n=1 Tax=Nakamurella sp. A5-74 TaxID=3158264 RepID=A0AAU8DKB7_9ACTN